MLKIYGKLLRKIFGNTRINTETKKKVPLKDLKTAKKTAENFPDLKYSIIMILIFGTSSPELLPSFMNPFIPDPFNPN